MGVRTDLLALTLTAGEIAQCFGGGASGTNGGQDIQGMLNVAEQKIVEAVQALDAMNSFIPSGTNKTAIGSAITALS